MSTLLTFKDIETRNSVRSVVVETARSMAEGAVLGQVGFGFSCLGYQWDAERAPVPGKWMISCGGEFFTDMVVGVDESKNL